jgi:LacI family transcriptional regulator
VTGKRARLERAALPRPVTLKLLAEHLGLSPATISLVINRSPVAKSIPKTTQERIFAAAARFDYRPNTVARSLRAKRTFTIGVMVPEISEGYAALVISGIEDYLLQAGYLYFVASHRHQDDLIDEYPNLLMARSVEGLIAVDTPVRAAQRVPVVAVSGHERTKGVSNIVLDHARAAQLALGHLHELGHRRIAFIKGQAFSSDTEERWRTIAVAARRLSIDVDSRLTAQLTGDSSSPELGYGAARAILASRPDFTALFAFNDISAIGAIRALREAGRRVPEDVSVVGFDDIQSAAFQNPSLTTVRQPLHRMGEVAAETLLRRISAPARAPYPRVLTVEPELVVRESTAAAREP